MCVGRCAGGRGGYGGELDEGSGVNPSFLSEDGDVDKLSKVFPLVDAAKQDAARGTIDRIQPDAVESALINRKFSVILKVQLKWE